jgi:hypothetical protein
MQGSIINWQVGGFTPGEKIAIIRYLFQFGLFLCFQKACVRGKSTPLQRYSFVKVQESTRDSQW